jgi:glycosyltransferase involved in cell wall biosynthesis
MTIVGDGRELAAVRAQANSAPFAGQVKCLGSRNQREVARLLDEHDFLLMTSHYEGTPHAALEAMAHGLVVLVSRIPGATDRIITHGVDGFLCDKDAPGDYVTVLRRFSKNPAEFATISSAAHRTVLSRYSADALAAKYEALLNGSRVSTQKARRNLNGQIEFPPELLPHFGGIFLQGRHRLGDIWRRVARGRRPVLPERWE